MGRESFRENDELYRDPKGDTYDFSPFTRRGGTGRKGESREPQLRNGANCAFSEEGAGSERRVRSRTGFPGNRVFPGLRHGFPLTRFTLAPVVVDDATATLTDQLHSLSQQVTESRSTGFKKRREISDEKYGQR
jgi:hypothetical protein